MSIESYSSSGFVDPRIMLDLPITMVSDVESNAKTAMACSACGHVNRSAGVNEKNKNAPESEAETDSSALIDPIGPPLHKQLEKNQEKWATKSDATSATGSTDKWRRGRDLELKTKFEQAKRLGGRKRKITAPKGLQRESWNLPTTARRTGPAYINGDLARCLKALCNCLNHVNKQKEEAKRAAALQKHLNSPLNSVSKVGTKNRKKTRKSHVSDLRPVREFHAAVDDVAEEASPSPAKSKRSRGPSPVKSKVAHGVSPAKSKQSHGSKDKKSASSKKALSVKTSALTEANVAALPEPDPMGRVNDWEAGLVDADWPGDEEQGSKGKSLAGSQASLKFDNPLLSNNDFQYIDEDAKANEHVDGGTGDGANADWIADKTWNDATIKKTKGSVVPATPITAVSPVAGGGYMSAIPPPPPSVIPFPPAPYGYPIGYNPVYGASGKTPAASLYSFGPPRQPTTFTFGAGGNQASFHAFGSVNQQEAGTNQEFATDKGEWKTNGRKSNKKKKNNKRT